MPRAVVILSGGLDSCTVLAVASKKYDCYALTFDYGQKHKAELDAAKNIAQYFSVKKHELISFDWLKRIGGSALTDETISVEDFAERTTIPTTYVPARNTLFLTHALAWAEVLHASAIFIGISAVDYSGYPDCRPAFLQAFQELAQLATQTGVEGERLTIEAPLLHLSKAQTIALGLQHGVDYAMTVSCYRANDQGEACGVCDACTYRRQGFASLGVADPTHYMNRAGVSHLCETPTFPDGDF